jgi:uncharacterized protein
MKDAVIVFEKEPVPGRVKTRLAKDIGQENAAKVYKELLFITHEVLKGVHASIFVYKDGEHSLNYENRGNYFYSLQKGNDLGQRMAHALVEVLKAGYSKALLIGTDCPEISKEILDRAFLALEKKDVVVGPALDGGYYLIGMKKPYPELFKSVSWSTEVVFKQTMDKIRNQGLSFAKLPQLRDVDDLEDLTYFRNKLSLER